MPKHRQPRELAELKGLTKKNPQRYRNEVPKNPYELGEPPNGLNKHEKAVWDELRNCCLPATLTSAERFYFEILCSLMVEFRRDKEAFPSMRLSILNNMLGKLGLNPCDRQKIGVTKNKEESQNFMDF